MNEMIQSKWRGFALPLVLTAIVVGSALAFAFS
jgi:hypothetical protein